MSKSNDDWIYLCKLQKSTFKNDVKPIVVSERDGEIVSVVVSPTTDKNAAFYAASICRKGLSADAIAIIVDAHMLECDNEEEVENLKNNDFQKMAEEGHPNIIECMVCHYVSKNKSFIISVPYQIANEEIKWKEATVLYVKEGAFHEALQEIITTASVLEKEELTKFKLSKDDMLARSELVVKALLISKGFYVMSKEDFKEVKHSSEQYKWN